MASTPPGVGNPLKSTEICGNFENFKIAKNRNNRNTSSGHAFGGARRFAPPLLVLRFF
jgi:hypothetical protein